MKKMFYSLLAVTAFCTFANASTIDLFTSFETEETIVDINDYDFENTNLSSTSELEDNGPGCASGCARFARNVILNAASTYGLDINRGGAHFDLMMEFYHEIYQDCYNGCSN